MRDKNPRRQRVVDLRLDKEMLKAVIDSSKIRVPEAMLSDAKGRITSRCDLLGQWHMRVETDWLIVCLYRDMSIRLFALSLIKGLFLIPSL